MRGLLGKKPPIAGFEGKKGSCQRRLVHIGNLRGCIGRNILGAQIEEGYFKFWDLKTN